MKAALAQGISRQFAAVVGMAVCLMCLSEVGMAVVVGATRPANPWQVLASCMLIDGGVKWIYVCCRAMDLKPPCE